MPVTVLDDISLKFDDTGMVFILGKSGSGKSTLLNVLGGLDVYDSGEFIIQGKSSKDFTQADFDSYRNTLIGFIFQEYNILNDFTVGANIALAMQLQGKKSTNEELNRILEEVDLVGYANRKPNELSGGQKQRVAIARALIKEPRIIMADEPTGALDSNTGRQVFDTLKKLSKNKLVIIVSHDREFAEYYGDRVIELADGKIISDITKYTAELETKSEGINVIDNKILHIKKGYKLTNEDLKLINGYLEKSESDTLMSLDERSNSNFKQLALIDDEGNKKSFIETTYDSTTNQDNETEELKLIKSRMPYKNSLKMGASGLKHKKFRLFITILLSIVAFSMFGLADTFAAYDRHKTTVQSIIDGKINIALFQKRVFLNDEDRYGIRVNADDSDLQRIKEKTGLNVKEVIDTTVDIQSYLNNTNLLNRNYYNGISGGIANFSDSDISNWNLNVIGRTPNALNEIAITMYHYEHFELAGYRNGLDIIETNAIDTPEKFLTQDILLPINGKFMKVVGIIDTKLNVNGEFDKIKNEETISTNASYQFYSELDNGLHSLTFVNNNFFEKYKSELLGLGRPLADSSAYHIINDNYNRILINRLINFNDIMDKSDDIFTVPNSQNLMKDEVMISLEDLEDILKSYNYQSFIVPSNAGELKYVEHDTETGNFIEKTEYITNLGDLENPVIKQLLIADNCIKNGLTITDQLRQTVINNYGSVSESEMEKAAIALISQYDVYNYLLTNETEDVRKKKAEILMASDVINLLNIKLSSTFKDYYKSNAKEEQVDLAIKGIFVSQDTNISNAIVCSEEFYESTKGILNDNGLYRKIMCNIPISREAIENLISFSYEKNDNVRYALTNRVIYTLDDFNEVIEILADVFIYVGLGFAIFAALMLMNFISTSISYKKREIGILRAVGARGSDVFGIFFNESAIIAGINFVFAVIGTICTCIGFNTIIRKELDFPITLLNVGIRQVSLIFAVTLVAAFIASLMPVMRIARKRPIDAIQNR